MSETVIIARRFNGPAHSGNGGYSCGRIARFIDGPAEVMLRAPPPLDIPLAITRDGARVLMHDGDTLIGEASPAHVDVTPPPAPSRFRAEEAARRYHGFHQHILPHCFVCGTSRAPGDGLRIFAGPLDGEPMVAASWLPDASCADTEGRVAPEFIWSALDCPTYWALPRAGSLMTLLARLAVSIDTPLPRVGEALILVAWPRASEGRKHRSAGALYTDDGQVLARAEALWIEPKPA